MPYPDVDFITKAKAVAPYPSNPPASEPIGKLDIRGDDIPVYLQGFRFTAHVDGSHYHADSIEDLRARLMEALRPRKVRVEVPFATVTRTAKPIKSVAIGLHASNGNVLVRHASGKTEQYNHLTGFKPGTDFDRLIELREAYTVARQALEEFETANTFNVKAAVREAVDRALGEEA